MRNPIENALYELNCAHQIISNALRVMSSEQKRKWGLLNERDGVAGDGITRANERQNALEQANAQ